MTDTHTEGATDRDYDDLLAEDDIGDRMDAIIDDVEQAQYEICLADPHIRYPDSAMHFGQIVEHLKAIKSFIQARQAHDTGLSAHLLYQHSTLCTVLDDEDKIKQLYED